MSQPFYFGRVNGHEYKHAESIGRPLDLCDELDDLIPPAKATGAGQGDQPPTNYFVTPEQVGHLRNALCAIPADDRDLWVRMGHALKTIGDQGRALWLEWSQKSTKYEAGDAAAKWDSFRPTTTDYRAVFAEAQRRGWQNPGAGSDSAAPPPAVALSDFWAYMPTHQYIFVPTREMWPAGSVDKRIAKWPQSSAGKPIAPSAWIDAHRPVDQMTWQPGEEQVIRDRVVQVSGWVEHRGAAVFNLYRPPARIDGDPSKAGPWIDHAYQLYPADAEHLIRWFAHRIQRAGEKVNHGLVLGGMQGIGKDTLLVPVVAGVGPWNWQEISPTQMLGRFNAWTKAVVVRVSESRDLGDVDRFSFYDHSKIYLAAPPDVLRVDEKHLREHYVANVMGMIITTNHTSDGLYLPAYDSASLRCSINPEQDGLRARLLANAVRLVREGWPRARGRLPAPARHLLRRLESTAKEDPGFLDHCGHRRSTRSRRTARRP